MKRRVYHLHIPKTGGQYISSTILMPLSKSFNDNNVNNVAYGHAAWKNITDDTYIISSFRNPAQRTVSHFCYYLKSHLNTENIEPNKQNLFQWIEQNKSYISNFQSKNLIYEKSQINTPFFFIKDTEFLKINSIDQVVLLNKIKRIDLLLKSENLSKEYAKTAQNKICADLKINKELVDEGTFFNENKESLNLYSDLSLKEIDYLFNINNIDSEIYFNDSLFKI